MSRNFYGSVEAGYALDEAPNGLFSEKQLRYRSLWFIIAGTIGFAAVNLAAKAQQFSIEEEQHMSDMNGIGKDSFRKSSIGLPGNQVEVSYAIDSSGLYIPSTDPKATKSTRALLSGLVKVANTKAIMFGHENTNVEGQYFWDEYGHKYQSDVANATDGGFPAVVGYNAQNILDGHNWTKHIIEAYSRGSVITFFWSAHNPVNAGTPRDCKGSPVTGLLPGGSGNSRWTENLDKIGSFFKSLRYEGEQIPIIFRLFHESTGDWYWWSKKCAKPAEYITAWRYTHHYLRDMVGVHNLLYIYAASKVSWSAYSAFHKWYPGQDHVDILGFDRYSSQTGYAEDMLEDCQAVVNQSRHIGKIVALAETGISNGIQDVTSASWFQKDFMKPMVEDELCQHIVYALTFANENPNRYWVPLEGQLTHPGFLAMYKSNESIFAGDERWDGIRFKFGIGCNDGNCLTDDALAAVQAQGDDALNEEGFVPETDDELAIENSGESDPDQPVDDETPIEGEPSDFLDDETAEALDDETAAEDNPEINADGNVTDVGEDPFSPELPNDPPADDYADDGEMSYSPDFPNDAPDDAPTETETTASDDTIELPQPATDAGDDSVDAESGSTDVDDGSDDSTTSSRHSRSGRSHSSRKGRSHSSRKGRSKHSKSRRSRKD